MSFLEGYFQWQVYVKTLLNYGVHRDPCTLSTDSSRDTIPIKRKYPTKMTNVSDPCAFSNLFVSENLEKTEEGREGWYSNMKQSPI
jgi:hypothetical protein